MRLFVFWLLRLLFPMQVRQIFVYHDGRHWKAIDPLVAWERLETHGEYDMANDPALVDVGDKEALQRMLKACDDTFGVTAFDAMKRTGLTIEERVRLMADFGSWMSDVKKKSVPSLTASQLLASNPWNESTTKPVSA